jgi:hypothetical protein
MYNPEGLGAVIIACCVVFAVLSAVMIFVLAYVAIFLALEIRPGAYRRELDIRYGSGWSWRERDELAAELAQPDGPTWVATLLWDAMPGGGSHRAQVKVWDRGPARLDVRSMAYPRSEADEDERSPKLNRFPIDMSAVEQSQVAELLRAQSPGETHLESAAVVDGAPTMLITLRKPPSDRSVLTYNACGTPASHGDHPDVRLAEWLFAAADRHGVRGA